MIFDQIMTKRTCHKVPPKYHYDEKISTFHDGLGTKWSWPLSLYPKILSRTSKMDRMWTVRCEGRSCRVTKSDFYVWTWYLDWKICCTISYGFFDEKWLRKFVLWMFRLNEDTHKRNLTPLMLDRKTSMICRLIWQTKHYTTIKPGPNICFDCSYSTFFIFLIF
jgi:hypothetical protein